MSKNAWEYTLLILKILTDIDDTNEALSKTNNKEKRKVLSNKIDSLEIQLFELKSKLKDIDIT